MGSPLSEISAILRDSLTQCIDTEAYLGDTRLVGDAFHHDEFWKIDTWIRWFEQDPAAQARYSRVVRAVDEAVHDLAALERATTGEPLHISPKLIAFLKLRVATAYFPHSDEIVRRATHGSAHYAAQQMLRHIPEVEWRRRS